METFSVGLIES